MQLQNDSLNRVMRCSSPWNKFTLFSRRSPFIVVMFLSGMGLLGCQYEPRGIPRGEVTGEVTFQGTPVTEGVVTFYSEKTGIAAPAALDASGKFEIVNGIEVGEYQVTITPPLDEEVAGAAPVKTGPPPTYENIPKKYRDSQTSGFQAEVVDGKNNFQFEMQ